MKQQNLVTDPSLTGGLDLVRTKYHYKETTQSGRINVRLVCTDDDTLKLKLLPLPHPTMTCPFEQATKIGERRSDSNSQVEVSLTSCLSQKTAQV